MALILQAGSDSLQACSDLWRGSTDYAEQRVDLDPSGCVRLARTPHNQELGIIPYQDHPHWSYPLHYDNLAALVKADPSLGALRSDSTVRRYMQAHGWA